MDKISIIVPVYNGSENLKTAIDSLLNQSIGRDNLEIIMVDDCSSDNSWEIISSYAENEDCCRAIHLEENSGSADIPRNMGIDASTGDFIMFLDCDDAYVADACKTLYNAAIENNADIAFARFKRVVEDKKIAKVSYSPYKDNLKDAYPNETLYKDNPLNISDKLWNYVEKIIYGKSEIENNDKIHEIIAENIHQYPDLLKIPPSIWTKIYRSSLIKDNDIKFPNYVIGEDRIFNLKAFLKAEGLCFLNDYICYNYKLNEEDSLSTNITFRFLDDLIDVFIDCEKLTRDYGKTIQNITINPNLFYWIKCWKDAELTKNENKQLLEKFQKLKENYDCSFKTSLILSFITSMVKIKS